MAPSGGLRRRARPAVWRLKRHTSAPPCGPAGGPSPSSPGASSQSGSGLGDVLLRMLTQVAARLGPGRGRVSGGGSGPLGTEAPFTSCHRRREWSRAPGAVALKLPAHHAHTASVAKLVVTAPLVPAGQEAGRGSQGALAPRLSPAPGSEGPWAAADRPRTPGGLQHHGVVSPLPRAADKRHPMDEAPRAGPRHALSGPPAHFSPSPASPRVCCGHLLMSPCWQRDWWPQELPRLSGCRVTPEGGKDLDRRATRTEAGAQTRASAHGSSVHRTALAAGRRAGREPRWWGRGPSGCSCLVRSKCPHVRT